jgi:hypothetical protein
MEASLFRKISGSWDAPDYPTCPCRVIMGPTEYCVTILLPKPSQNRIVGFLGSPNLSMP